MLRTGEAIPRVIVVKFRLIEKHPSKSAQWTTDCRRCPNRSSPRCRVRGRYRTQDLRTSVRFLLARLPLMFCVSGVSGRITMSEWFVSIGAKTHGPFSSSQLRRLAAATKINHQTDVQLGLTGRRGIRLIESKGLVRPKPFAAIDFPGRSTQPLDNDGATRAVTSSTNGSKGGGTSCRYAYFGGEIVELKPQNRQNWCNLMASYRLRRAKLCLTSSVSGLRTILVLGDHVVVAWSLDRIHDRGSIRNRWLHSRFAGDHF
jgi:hypothetical protein